MYNQMSSWKENLAEHLAYHGETWLDVEYCTLSEEELNRKFDHGYGSAEGEPFTLWTKSRVYFPTEYDGAEGVASVSRNPDGKPTEHI